MLKRNASGTALVLAALVSAAGIGCNGGSDAATASGGHLNTGGSTGSGGERSSTASAKGGSTSATGGVSTGASNGSASGGQTTGGGSAIANGGSAAGGVTTGGTGGSASGGNAMGGSATGGVATGGKGGTATSGNTTGGSARGGTTSGAASGGAATGGATGSGGSPGAGGASAGGRTGQGPCDIYQAANTPCVAAHSTVRALYGSYNGPLYQVRRALDKTTKDVPPLAAGGIADTSVQDSFCTGTTCTISMIYDQSPQHNDLPVAPKTAFMPGGGLEANAADGKIRVGGHVVHGVTVIGDPNFIANKKPNVAYRNNKTKGVATGTQAEAMYMVFDGKLSSSNCCFDYGNAETTGTAGPNATMEALYWGSSTWYSKGVGTGPWVGGDYENGMYYGDGKGNPPNATNTTVTGMEFVTGMLKGYTENRFGLKAGNAQSGKLETKWDGARPNGYATKKLEGAIILCTGGDGSQGGSGTFFEGAMTIGMPSDATDDAVQANIVAAGYGK